MGANGTEPSVKIKSAVQRHKWELDALEQYSRRDNIKVFGVPEQTHGSSEDCNQVILDLGKKIGVEVSPGDISVSHRVRGGGDGPRPIVAKFVRRDVKSQFMKNKKKLKELGKGSSDDGAVPKPKIFINDDLTLLRGKLLREVKKDPNVERAYTLDGRVHCIMKQKPSNAGQGGREKRITLDNPDDLFKLGWTEEQMRDTKLFLDI